MTALIIEFGASVLFLLLALVSGVGLLVAWLVFRTRDRHNEFTRADSDEAVVEETARA